MAVAREDMEVASRGLRVRLPSAVARMMPPQPPAAPPPPPPPPPPPQTGLETIFRKRGESIAVGAIAVALNRDPC